MRDPPPPEIDSAVAASIGPAAPALMGPDTASQSPLALASLALGPRRSETGLREIGSGELARVRRGHETGATRARGKLFRCWLQWSAGVSFRRQVR